MAVSEPLDPVLTEHSLSLLRAIGREGIAMVEFKHDRHAQRPLLMEVNGRYWGSIGLAKSSCLGRLATPKTAGRLRSPILTRERYQTSAAVIP